MMEESISACDNCSSYNISKTEDVQGVEVEYNLEFNEEEQLFEWVEANQNWYGETSISYECNDCGHKWQ